MPLPVIPSPRPVLAHLYGSSDEGLIILYSDTRTLLRSFSKRLNSKELNPCL